MPVSRGLPAAAPEIRRLLPRSSTLPRCPNSSRLSRASPIPCIRQISKIYHYNKSSNINFLLYLKEMHQDHGHFVATSLVASSQFAISRSRQPDRIVQNFSSFSQRCAQMRPCGAFLSRRQVPVVPKLSSPPDLNSRKLAFLKGICLTCIQVRGRMCGALRSI
jgi:hypothetical protein